MRFRLIASLIAGVALVVIGLAAIIGRRGELGDERDRRLETAAELAAAQLDAAVARVSAVLTVATAETTVDAVADAVAAPVCSVAGAAPTCSTSEVARTDDPVVAAALAASARRGVPAVLVGMTTGGPDGTSTAGSVVVAVDHGARRLYVPLTLDTSVVPASDIVTELVPLDGEPLFRARTVMGRRSVAAPSMVEFEDGPWAVRATAPTDVRLSGDERWLIGAQLATGAVLAVVALGGMLAEQRALHRRATTDALTHLPNRAEFERRATEMLARLGRDGRTACLMVIDLDHFKVVNDTVGHDAGDRVLADAAERLRQAVRGSDLVGRWGGDEFVVLMPGVADARAVPARAATIANALAGLPTVGTYEVAASVGAALFPAHGRLLDDLLRKADRAMYAAKVQGTPHHVAGRAPNGLADRRRDGI